MGDLVSDRPMCPTCKHRMALRRISPGTRGFEERTFECSTCERTEKVSVAVDPMKTNALALQLLFLRASESMGNHDSNVVGAGRVG
jgi:hypothetical protein